MNATANPTTMNVQEFKAWMTGRGDGLALAKVLFVRMAFAQLERERVDAYVAPIFAKYGFRKDNDFGGKFRPDDFGSLLTKPADLYLSADEAGHARFYAECDEAHRAHGFTGPAGNCPALTAEHAVTSAEWALLEAAGVKLGFDGKDIYGKNREKMLEILLGAASIALKK